MYDSQTTVAGIYGAMTSVPYGYADNYMPSIVIPEHGLDFPMNVESKNLFSKTNKRSCSRVPVVAALTGGFGGLNHVLSAAGNGRCPADRLSLGAFPSLELKDTTQEMFL